MQRIKTLDTSELICKRDLLAQATITLKKEFFGIDSVIDQIIESISPWYFFPHMQERPVVVNLWGMTGVGKSDLLQRLIQLLKLNDKYFHFDMSEIADGQTSLNTEFSMAYQAMNKKPVIFAFDEFQLARSIDEETKEALRIADDWEKFVDEIVDTLKNPESDDIPRGFIEKYSWDSIGDIICETLKFTGRTIDANK